MKLPPADSKSNQDAGGLRPEIGTPENPFLFTENQTQSFNPCYFLRKSRDKYSTQRMVLNLLIRRNSAIIPPLVENGPQEGARDTKGKLFL